MDEEATAPSGAMDGDGADAGHAKRRRDAPTFVLPQLPHGCPTNRFAMQNIGPNALHRRRVVTQGDQRWLIEERESASALGSRGRRSLICFGDTVVRRIWDYPADWHALSDDALLRLCGEAESEAS